MSLAGRPRRPVLCLALTCKLAVDGPSGTIGSPIDGHRDIGIPTRPRHDPAEPHVDLASLFDGTLPVFDVRELHEDADDLLSEPTQREGEPPEHMGLECLRYYDVSSLDLDSHLGHVVGDGWRRLARRGA
jgi:hypothetical protein